MLNLLYAPGLGKIGISKIQAEAMAILSHKIKHLVWTGKEFNGLTDEMAEKVVASAITQPVAVRDIKQPNRL